jgi:hypothetical protein
MSWKEFLNTVITISNFTLGIPDKSLIGQRTKSDYQSLVSVKVGFQ